MVNSSSTDSTDMPYSTKHLSRFQLASLIRLGDLYIPGTEKLPCFSKSQCLQHLDVVMDGLHPDDIAGVRWLLVALRFVPKFMLRKLMSMMDHHDQYPEWVACPLRLVNLAFKGLVMSLYYSGLPVEGNQLPGVLEKIGYQLHCEMDGTIEEQSSARSVS